jgi:hypothetical protein
MDLSGVKGRIRKSWALPKRFRAYRDYVPGWGSLNSYDTIIDPHKSVFFKLF